MGTRFRIHGETKKIKEFQMHTTNSSDNMRVDKHYLQDCEATMTETDTECTRET